MKPRKKVKPFLSYQGDLDLRAPPGGPPRDEDTRGKISGFTFFLNVYFRKKVKPSFPRGEIT